VGETRRITTTRSDSLIPAIAAWRRGWVLTWIEYEGTGHDERGRSQVLPDGPAPRSHARSEAGSTPR